jgi:hypothetical protein
MKSWFMNAVNSSALQWLGFLSILLLVVVCLGGFIVWLQVGRNKQSKRKRRHRHRRPVNPTLAQTGGLPPRRDPNQPPPGP